MFKNYLKITLRNIRKHKAYSFINIAGLGIGLAACVLILLYVQDVLLSPMGCVVLVHLLVLVI